MKLLQRIKYLWKLSRNALSYEEQVALHYKEIGFNPGEKIEEKPPEKPKPMATIIKRKLMSVDEEVNEILGEKKEYE